MSQPRCLEVINAKCGWHPVSGALQFCATSGCVAGTSAVGPQQQVALSGGVNYGLCTRSLLQAQVHALAKYATQAFDDVEDHVSCWVFFIYASGPSILHACWQGCRMQPCGSLCLRRGWSVSPSAMRIIRARVHCARCRPRRSRLQVRPVVRRYISMPVQRKIMVRAGLLCTLQLILLASDPAAALLSLA